MGKDCVVTSDPRPDAEDSTESDPLDAADDGMAPLVTNTGDDEADSDDAGAPTG